MLIFKFSGRFQKKNVNNGIQVRLTGFNLSVDTRYLTFSTKENLFLHYKIFHRSNEIMSVDNSSLRIALDWPQAMASGATTTITNAKLSCFIMN